MARLSRRWDTPRSLLGDVVLLSFVLTQCLDGGLTYLGVSLWGPEVEGNPVHNIVALLTAIYVVCAIVPWTSLFLIRL